MLGGAEVKSHLNYYNNRTKIPFTDIAEDRCVNVDEYGLRETKLRLNWWNVADHHAHFTHHVDFRIDLINAMKTIAEEYDDDVKGLIALYRGSYGIRQKIPQVS